MILNRVTVTGVDDSIRPQDLLSLSRQFPYVEWGILLSKSQEGHSRFPSLGWMKELFNVSTQDFLSQLDKAELYKMNISGHLCGSWVRNLCIGNDEFFQERFDIAKMFGRFQLNFHSYLHTVDKESFIKVLKEHPVQYIFQLENVNEWIVNFAREQGINAVPLFDLSGGAGVLPKQWPKAYPCYSGYAGGLSPDNVDEQLKLIEQAAEDKTIWIDVETNVRSLDDRQFDLDKVRKFLIKTKQWVL